MRILQKANTKGDTIQNIKWGNYQITKLAIWWIQGN